jgi:hypothetical protein
MKNLTLLVHSTRDPFVYGWVLLPKESLFHQVKSLLTDHTFLDADLRYDNRGKTTPLPNGISFIEEVIELRIVQLTIEFWWRHIPERRL